MGSFTGSLTQAVLFRYHKFAFSFFCRCCAVAQRAFTCVGPRAGVEKAPICFSNDKPKVLFLRTLCFFYVGLPRIDSDRFRRCFHFDFQDPYRLFRCKCK